MILKNNNDNYLNIMSFQAGNSENSLEERITKLKDILQYADSINTDIVLTPECYLTGYFSDKQKTLSSALSKDDNRMLLFLEEIKQYKSTLIVGLNNLRENKIYNTAFVIEEGIIKGEYNKIYCSYDFHTSGKDFALFSKKNIEFGIIICRDANYVEPARIYALKGAKIIFCLLNNSLPYDVAVKWNDRSKNNLIARAVENGCFIVSSDIAYQDTSSMSFGASYIINHDGEIIRKSVDFKEDILVYSIPLSEFNNRKVFFGSETKKYVWEQLNNEMVKHKLS